MQLNFEFTKTLGSGVYPAAVHMKNNSVILLAVDETGTLSYRTAEPGIGDVDWGNLTFDRTLRASKDINVRKTRIKNVPRLGIYGVWLANGNDFDRHRFAIYEEELEISRYLSDGEMRMSYDSMISDFSLTLQNPKGLLSQEDRSRIAPGIVMKFYLQVNGSEEYPMGTFYVDRVDVKIGAETIKVEGRNISGKLLKDQSFGSTNTFGKNAFAYTLEAVLQSAGIENYDVQQPDNPETAWQVGIEYPKEMAILDGLHELIMMSRNWIICETLDGQIVAGSTVTYPAAQINSKYTMSRGADLFSRGLVRDDSEVYGEVCVHTEDFTVEEYVDVEPNSDWVVASKKTLFVKVADNTPMQEAIEMAEDIAERIASSGTIESFSGPFRPQLLPGDEVEIIGSSTRLLGLITSVRHSFGINGYQTTFEVDSGGRKGQPRMRDYLQKLTGQPKSGTVKRL